MGPVTRHMPPRHRLVKHFDLVQDDAINGLSSQIMLQSDDSLQIGTCVCVEKIQRIKVSHMVVAPLCFGRRS
jgi:hypothetical protein